MTHDLESIRKAIGNDLHSMLVGWGRAMRPTTKTATSPTYEICNRLAVLAGVVEVQASSGASLAERNDAELTEKAWSFSTSPVGHKRALAMLYVWGLPLPVIARKVKMPIGACHDGIVAAAVSLNRTRVNIILNGLPEDNRAYNLLPGNAVKEFPDGSFGTTGKQVVSRGESKS